MAITTQLGKQLYQKCQLDRRKQELELEKLALEEQLPQAKAARREADTGSSMGTSQRVWEVASEASRKATADSPHSSSNCLAHRDGEDNRVCADRTSNPSCN